MEGLIEGVEADGHNSLACTRKLYRRVEEHLRDIVWTWITLFANDNGRAE